jgi:hypothetical protein
MTLCSHGREPARCEDCKLGRAADRALYQPPVPGEPGSIAPPYDKPDFDDWSTMWLKPIRRQVEMAGASLHKPLAEVTVDEVVAWGILLTYSYVAGALLGRVLARLVA